MSGDAGGLDGTCGSRFMSVPSIDPPGVVVVVADGRPTVLVLREEVVVGLAAVVVGPEAFVVGLPAVVRLTELACGDDEPHADTPIRATSAKTTEATDRFPM